jgi:hypothetical protein
MRPPQHRHSSGNEEDTGKDKVSDSDQHERKPPAMDRSNKQGEAVVVIVPSHDEGAEEDGVELSSESSHSIPSSCRTPQDILCGEFSLSLSDRCCPALLRQRVFFCSSKVVECHFRAILVT